jgi:hypothetical protein
MDGQIPHLIVQPEQFQMYKDLPQLGHLYMIKNLLNESNISMLMKLIIFIPQAQKGMGMLHFTWPGDSLMKSTHGYLKQHHGRLFP